MGVKIKRPFWMATCEVTNEQFNKSFAPNHDSRVESKNTYQFGIHGYPMNLPRSACGAGLLDRGHIVLQLAFRTDRREIHAAIGNPVGICLRRYRYGDALMAM